MCLQLILKGRIVRFAAASAAEGDRSSCNSEAAIVAPPSPIVCLLVDASASTSILMGMWYPLCGQSDVEEAGNLPD